MPWRRRAASTWLSISAASASTRAAATPSTRSWGSAEAGAVRGRRAGTVPAVLVVVVVRPRVLRPSSRSWLPGLLLHPAVPQEYPVHRGEGQAQPSADLLNRLALGVQRQDGLLVRPRDGTRGVERHPALPKDTADRYAAQP